MKEKKFTAFENLLITVFFNATTKFISAVQLYGGKISYNDAFFLCVIAQEELAKLFLLPIARELNEIEDISGNRNNPFYRHAIKQKIYTSWGMQDREHRDIEGKKQRILYVGLNGKCEAVFDYVKPEEVLIEIKHLAYLLVHTYVDILSQLEFGEKFKKGMKFFMDNAYECAETDLPELNTLIEREVIDLESLKPEELKERQIKRLLSNPYELIKMCKAVFKEDYKTHLKSMSLLTFSELEDYLGKYYASK